MPPLGAGLRLTAADAVLSADPACELPPWLVAPFRRDAAADAPGLLRVLLRHARLAEAADLATARLSAASVVPSRGMGSPAAVAFPQELLDLLVLRLETHGGSGGGDAGRALGELKAVLARQRQAAAVQSEAVVQVFA